jgi:hypothetical protein
MRSFAPMKFGNGEVGPNIARPGDELIPTSPGDVSAFTLFVGAAGD